MCAKLRLRAWEHFAMIGCPAGGREGREEDQLDNGGSCACHGGEDLNQGREAMGPQLHWDDLFIRKNP